MAIEDVHSTAQRSISTPQSDTEESSGTQAATLKGNNVTIHKGGMALALLMEETMELSSYPVNDKTEIIKKKNKHLKKASTNKSQDSDDEDDQPVEKIKEVEDPKFPKEQQKQQDPFFQYRDLKDERDKLIEETSAQDRSKIKDKLDSINSQMAKLYVENKELIDSSTAIDPAVQSAVAEFKDKTLDISEVDIHENYRDINKSYKDPVLDYGPIRETYNKIIETYTEEYFEDGLRTLTSALSDDLNRFNTQIEGGLSDKTQLSLIVQDMYKLKNLHSFYLKCSELLEDFTTEKVPMASFVNGFLELLEKNWVETTDVEEVTNLIGTSPKDKKVLAFLNRMLLAVKSVPADNTYSTGSDGINTELFDAINSIREEKAKQENKVPLRGSGA
jgi:hypothetical protein